MNYKKRKKHNNANPHTNLMEELAQSAEVETIVDFYIDREFMELLNQEVMKNFGLAPTFLLGNLSHIGGLFSTGGFHDALEQVCQKLDREGLIEYLKGLNWIKYDWATSHIELTCARQFHLYTPKYRWRAIYKNSIRSQKQ